jgi:phosphopantothenoylcysteine decarboxylase/phosphopantothenate--cysteine ligase
MDHPRIEKIEVRSAKDMFEACDQRFPEADIAVLAAAVADYRPIEVQAQKMKKKAEHMQLELEKTVDIAAELGGRKQPGQIIAGFALETDNELVNAREKLKKKNFDMIVLNSLRHEGAGFGHDTNRISILMEDGKEKDFGLKSKREVALDIVNEIITLTDEI